MARKTADLEILLERKRLSGELHDHLSQLVNTMNMGVETALLSWEECNTDRVRNDLERIKGVGQEAARALREEMLSLRLPTSETEGLIQQVREYLQRFERQWRIDTDLQVEGGLEPLIVATQMELQFMRILHESLANVIRHATASHVSVLLHVDQDRLSMQIHDNGRGFDPEDVSSERLGLRIMRERAESLGGELTIESSSGTGTMIRVDVPHHS
jgi:signal transduction histidine kinase